MRMFFLGLGLTLILFGSFLLTGFPDPCIWIPVPLILGCLPVLILALCHYTRAGEKFFSR